MTTMTFKDVAIGAYFINPNGDALRKQSADFAITVHYSVRRHVPANTPVEVVTRCVGCFQTGSHARGCPTGANGNPDYS